MEESVVLVVKAPNQQIEDQAVNCELSWTVRRLKGHLSEVYPSKPRLEDQKLIYSGQLLNDSSTLKDVLREYEGQKNHTLHLVCSPSKESLKATSLNTRKTTPMTPSPNPSQQHIADPGNSPVTGRDGLRHRAAQGIPVAPVYTPWTLSQPPQTAGSSAPSMWPMMGTYDAANMAQQMAWMQQAYAHYMTQYMQLMASGNMPVGMQMPASVNATSPAAAPPPVRDEPAPADEVVQNGDEEELLRGNRDWLDWFYIMSRVLVLFSIVYFYSSPVRFFLVSTLAILMYLYQVGFFRAVQRLEQQEEVVIAQAAPENNNAPAPDSPPAEPPTPPAVPPAPSALAITWAAFSSFFLSLIPEQPNVL